LCREIGEPAQENGCRARSQLDRRVEAPVKFVDKNLTNLRYE
jgi:hypothetical protein